MVNLNKGFLIKGMKEKSWKELFIVIKKAKSAKELESVLAKWLTDAEKGLLEKRVAIDLLLREGVGHNEIKRRLDVSSQTVSFVKRGLTRPSKKKMESGKLKAEFKKPKKQFHRFPSYTGKGRWNFLNTY